MKLKPSVVHFIPSSPKHARASQKDKEFVSVGDVVMWRGAWGREKPRLARVLSIEKTNHPDEKYGKKVDRISTKTVRSGRAILILDNGHFAFAYQIDLPNADPKGHEKTRSNRA